MQGALIFQLT